MSRIIAVIGLALAFPVTAYAADAGKAPPSSTLYGVLTIEAASDYVPRGISLSTHQPTLKGKVEVGYNAAYRFMIYGFASVINTSFADATREIDMAVGVRPMITPVLLDFGLAHYDFDGIAIADFSEAYAGTRFTIPVGGTGQGLTFLGLAFLRLDNKDTYFEGNLDYALTKKLALSGRLGQVNGALTYQTYGIALKYAFLPEVVGELRYLGSSLTPAECFGTNLCDSRLMAKLTMDVNLAPLFAGRH